ncbi:hypothetical protein KJ359_007049 [Pestalotiopsis sp. 9143b]|nr:hypothetical protein KJ359_007049 [Pestalotiopsis sp. 9143b]
MSPAQPEEVLCQPQAVGSAYANKKPGAREQLINLCHSLISTLELPSEAIQRMGWAEPARAAHCRIAVELKLFEILENGHQGLSAEHVAEEASTNPVLVSRMLKHLAAMHVIGENEKEFTSTPLSTTLTEPKYRDGIIYTYDVAGPSFRHLPEYLKSTGFALPTELADGPFQAAHKSQLPFFAWLDQNPPYLEVFSNYMSAYRAGKPSWVDPGFYPIRYRLGKVYDPDCSEVLLVDVGGGIGHDLQELKRKHPDLPGKLVLQDRAQVIATVPDAGVVFEPMDRHDQLIDQDRRVAGLHGGLQLFENLDAVVVAPVVEERVQIISAGVLDGLRREEIVERKASWPITSMDHLMMVLGAMKERTQADWENILTRAGFKVVQVYSYEMGSESLIEAELA